MFISKKKYFLYLNDYLDFDLNLIKIKNKFSVIYNGNIKKDKVKTLKLLRRKCKEKHILFYVSNNLKLANNCMADGLYISSYNKKRYQKSRHNFRIIGSAHNFKEIFEKQKQGCNEIILSRLLRTDYKEKKGYLGVSRFNLISRLLDINLVPLGGIRLNNINKLKTVNSRSFMIMSEVKKKPAIISRLF